MIQEIGKDATDLLMNEALYMTTPLENGADRLSRLKRVFICILKG